MTAWGFVDEDSAHAFTEELHDLIGRYRHAMPGPQGDELDECIANGFDEDAPEMITGIVMLVAHSKIDGDWQRSFHYRPPGQDSWLSIGLADDLLRWFQSLR